MLNTFPELLAFSQLAPFILRVILGLIFLDMAYLKLFRERVEWTKRLEAMGMKWANVVVIGIIQFVIAALLIIGLYTQIAAIAAAVFAGISLYIEYKDAAILRRDLVFYILVFVIALSLILTGAGSYAFDIPL